MKQRPHDQLRQSFFFKNAIAVTGGTARRQKAAVPYLHGRNNMHREKKKGTKKKTFTMKKEKDIERGKIPELYMFP